ncbi:MAG: hypothetical protein LBG30_03650 [Odoribacteraceae bacterium]|jgi:hypothetical protein|nr:hypothetical protein [Odoribacteraceae bacterium]
MKRISILAIVMLATTAASCTRKGNDNDQGQEEITGESPALVYLRKEISNENKQFVVYRDFGDGCARFTQRAALNPSGKAEPVMNEREPSPHGVSCIRVAYPLISGDWNGFIFITGRLDAGASAPAPDFGQHDTGYDLRGATKLTFKARGKSGGEKVRFYMGGLGGTDAPFRDSDQVFLSGGDYVTLASEWNEYTIDLSRADLSRVACGFGWVTAQSENPGAATLEFYLDEIVYHFAAEQYPPRFLRSYGVLPLDDERSSINNFAYVYDNALLAIALAKNDHLEHARQIADALVYCVEHDRYYAPGPIRNAYVNSTPVSFPGWRSARGSEFAMLPTVYTASGQWQEDRYATSINTGVMAWAIEALLTVYDKTRTTAYLNTAATMANYLLTRCSANDPLGGFTGGEEGWDGETVKLTYKSTEHNIDLVSAFSHLHRILETSRPQEAAKYLEAARQARDFVLAMYDNGCFYTGTGNDGTTINRDNRPLDTNTWAILALTPDDRWSPEAVYAFIERTFKVGEGVDYNADRDGVWNEGVGQLAVAASLLDKQEEYTRLTRYLNSVAEADGSIRAASKDGLTTGFSSTVSDEDGSLRVIPFVYDHRISLASTAWLAFAQLRINPYFSAE